MLSQEFSVQNCDRCFKWKKKCSKHINGCVRCLASNVECSYLNIRQRVRRSIPLLEYQKEGFSVNIKNLKIPLDSSFEHKIDQIILKTTLLSYLLGLNNIDRHTKEPQERLAIVGILGVINKFRPDIFKKRKSSETKLIESPLAIYGTEELNQQSIDAYFKYFNSMFPLFDKKTFLKKKDRVIKLTVLAAGLRFIQEKVNFLDLLHEELNYLVTKRMHKPDINLVQSLFIISYFLYSYSIFNKAIRYSNFNLLSLCYCLGLPYKKDLQSVLTWNTLVNYKQFGMFLSRVIIPECWTTGCQYIIKDEKLEIRFRSLLLQNMIVKQILYARSLSNNEAYITQMVSKMEVITQSYIYTNQYPYVNNMNHKCMIYLILKALESSNNLKTNSKIMKLYQSYHLQLINLHLKYQNVPLLSDQFFLLTSTISSLVKTLNYKKIKLDTNFKSNILSYYKSFYSLSHFANVITMHSTLIERLLKIIK